MATIEEIQQQIILLNARIDRYNWFQDMIHEDSCSEYETDTEESAIGFFENDDATEGLAEQDDDDDDDASEGLAEQDDD